MKTIRPLLYYQLSIKNFSAYQGFLNKRPKKIRALKFSTQETPYGSAKNKNDETKLFKVLSTLRSLREVDLSQTQLEQTYFGKCRLLSAFKKISKVKTIFMSRRLKAEEKDTFTEESLKCFPQIQFFSYHLTLQSYKNGEDVQIADVRFPLKFLRYCRKLQNFLLSDDQRCYSFQKVKMSLRYLHHFLSSPLSPRHPTKCLSELISVQFLFYNFCPEFYQESMKLLSKLPNLQEIDLWLICYFSTLDLEKALKKIAEKGILKKVKLVFKLAILNLEGVLKALSHSQLTSFSLKTFTYGDQLLAPLALLLKKMNQLKSLDLEITNKLHFTTLNKICKQISKLKFLRHLKFAFNSQGKFMKDQRLSNFLPYLHHLFTKPIKLKTLHFSCNQVNAPGTHLDLITALQPLQTSLYKLEIDLGTQLHHQRFIHFTAKFVETLAHIQVLKLPSLTIKENKSLKMITKAVLELQHLETLFLGHIEKTVKVAVFLTNMEMLFCKRGLKKFSCCLPDGIWKKLRENRRKGRIYPPDLKQIIKANPDLENVCFYSFYCGEKDYRVIHQWRSIWTNESPFG